MENTKLKIGQRVYFLIGKRIKNGGRNKTGKRYMVESGKIQELNNVCAIIETKNNSVHNRTFDNIFLSLVNAKKSI
jgi:hypothetical protein